MVITYIKWRDACYIKDYAHVADLSLIDLEEIGWLVKETEEAITLCLERPEKGQQDYRLSLTIPKVNIIQRQEINISRKVNAKKTNSNSRTGAQNKKPSVEMQNGS